MITRYIQLGNAKQCQDNGLPGWSYIFGNHTVLKGTVIYNYKGNHNNCEYTFSAKPSDCATFVLTLYT